MDWAIITVQSCSPFVEDLPVLLMPDALKKNLHLTVKTSIRNGISLKNY